MATAVLHAQDFLDLHRKGPHHGFMGAIYYGGAKSSFENPKKSQSHHNRRKAAGHAHGSSPQKSCNPKGVVSEFQEKKRPFNKSGESGKQSLKNQNQSYQKREQSQPKDFVSGHVTILKRGQSLESKGHMMGRLGVSPPKSGSIAGQMSTGGSRIARSVSTDFKQPVKFAEEWAGPAFANSPSPRSLPLPNFPVKKASSKEENAAAQIDNLATRDLRRLLGLD